MSWLHKKSSADASATRNHVDICQLGWNVNASKEIISCGLMRAYTISIVLGGETKYLDVEKNLNKNAIDMVKHCLSKFGC